MSRAFPPRPRDLDREADELDRLERTGRHPADDLLDDQAHDDARRDRSHDYAPNPIRSHA